MTTKDFTQLIDAHLAGELTAREAALLSETLAADADARRTFWEMASVDGLTQEAARLEWLESAGGRSPAKVVRPVWWRALAVAAALAVSALWFVRRDSPAPVTGVAIFAQAVGSDQQGGRVLPPGMVELESGAALLEFYSGARVVVEAPVRFELVSADEAYLHAGKVTAYVPPQAHGFTVGTPDLTVVDLGTAFGMSVAEGTPPEVHVFEGLVEVAIGSEPKRALQGGEAGALDATIWQPLPADAGAFVTEEEFARRAAFEADTRRTTWAEASSALADDPATLLYFDFEVPASDPATVGGEWETGRWPGTRALGFRDESDRVRVAIEPTFSAVTFLAWVRLDSLHHPLNALLSADAAGSGSLRWEITREGQLRLGIGRGNDDWEVVEGTRTLTPNRLGQWHLLATTFDGTTVRHYLDGRPAGDGKSFTPPALRIGTADIGNWRGPTPRHLDGRLDVFALLSRALRPDEILALHQKGHP